MAKKTISEDRDEQWLIQGDNDTWTLEKDATITVVDPYAIKVGAGSTGNTVRVLGDILKTGSDKAGIGVFGQDTKLIIGEFSKINAGEDGIYLGADEVSVINRGVIEGQVSGIVSEYSNQIRNSGEITGQQYGINSVGHDMDIVNNAGAYVSGATFGITLSDADNAKIVNNGTISGGDYAVLLDGAGDNWLVNIGTIEGNVLFDVGNDLIDTRKGTITGTIEGGDGNDRYKVGSLDAEIVEHAGNGHDIIYSTVGFELPDNVEQLVLIGNVGCDAKGNDGYNFITGNKAQNTISGGMGDDEIRGAGGNDFVAGEEGEDTFIFVKGDDRDTIFDFQDGADTIRIREFDGVHAFDDLSSHISQHGDDVWIAMGGGDRLVLRNVDAGTLGETDFEFDLVG